MEFSAQLGQYGTNWSDIKETVLALEAGRWNSVFFSDHFMPPGNPANGHGIALEGWTVLTAIASHTRRLRRFWLQEIPIVIQRCWRRCVLRWIILMVV